ncbi:MAG: thiol peroxidase [Weeksellaceae bacterium]|nr:thiol peroxidase [Weeksellaceae bacterium]
MADIQFKGDPVKTSGQLPAKASKATDFELVSTDLSTKSLKDFEGKRVIMNIFPSLDTGVCATSVREFNKRAAALDNTVVLNISRDLPFAQKRFCGAEGIDNVEMLSDFRGGKFGGDYGLDMTDGPLEGLLSRSVIVLDEDHNVVYSEQVPEITQEPDYDSAINTFS